jgi:hypothetical protein
VLNGRRDIEPRVREALKPLESFDLAPDSYAVEWDQCTNSFASQGVPTLDVESDRASAAASPVALDQIDFRELKLHAAVAGVTAFDIAEDVAPLGPRLSPAEVGAVLAQAPHQ